MIITKMVDKYRNSMGKIVGYLLMDKNGFKKEFLSDDLKIAIIEGKIQVVNLTLTSDNRLIESSMIKKEKIEKSKNSENIEIIVGKSENLEKSKIGNSQNLEESIIGIVSGSDNPLKSNQKSLEENIIGKSQKFENKVNKKVDVSGSDNSLKSNPKSLEENIIGKSQNFENKVNKKVGIFKEKGKETYTIGYSLIHKINSIVPEKLKWYFVTPFDEKCKNLKLEKVEDITESVKISYEDNSELAIIINTQKIYLVNSDRVDSIFGQIVGVFERCSMSSLDLHNINTMYVTKMNSMFFSCKLLESIELGNFDTSNVIDMSNVFCFCNSLQSIDLSSFDTSNVKFMDSMFYNCSSLQSLDLRNFNTFNVKKMSHLFGGCKSLQWLDLSSFNTSNVIKMWCMFCDCESLEKLDLSSFDTSNVTSMEGMFGGCESLQSLDLSSFNTSNVLNMERMFENCKSLENLDLSGFDTLKEVRINNMFKGVKKCAVCRKIEKDIKNMGGEEDSKLLVPPHFIVSKLKEYNTKNIIKKSKETYIIGYSVIHKINSVVPKELNWYFVTPFEERYKNLKLEKVEDISDSVKISYESNRDLAIIVNAQKIYLANSKIVNNGVKGVFEGCSMYNLDLYNIDTLKVKNMSFMLENCKSLYALKLSDFNTSHVTDMSHMFDGCESLQSINLSSFDTSNVTTMENMFSGCKSLQWLDLSSFDTSNVTDMSCMFNGCKFLESIDLSSFDTLKVRDMDYMFEGVENCDIFCKTKEDKEKMENSKYKNAIGSLPDFYVIRLERYNEKSRETYILDFDVIHKINMVVPEKLNWYFVTPFEERYKNLKLEKTEDISESVKISYESNSDLAIIVNAQKIYLANSKKRRNSPKGIFYECCMSSLDLHNIDTSKVIDMSEMFCGCESLESIDLHNIDTSKVIDMSGMFCGCVSLESIDLHNIDTSKVTDMIQMFCSCESLESIDLHNIDTSKVTCMSYMFEGCVSLQSLDLSSFDISNVESMNSMFNNISEDCYIYCHSEKDKKKMLDKLSKYDNLSVENFIVGKPKIK